MLDVINFDNEKIKKNKERKGFNCQMFGHKAKDCRLKRANTEQTRGQPIKCFKRGEQGHISIFLRNRNQKKFCKPEQKD